MKITKNDALFWLGLILAIWFAFAGIIWVYWLAAVIAYPFGLLSFILWLKIRKENTKRVNLIPIILVVGLSCSLAVLVFLLLRG
jgi:hypothetical protein